MLWRLKTAVRNDLDYPDIRRNNSLLALETRSNFDSSKFRVVRHQNVEGPQSTSIGSNDIYGQLAESKKLDEDKVNVLQASIDCEKTMLLSVAKKLRGSPHGLSERFVSSNFDMRGFTAAAYDRMVILSWLERCTANSELQDDLWHAECTLAFARIRFLVPIPRRFSVSKHSPFQVCCSRICAP